MNGKNMKFPSQFLLQKNIRLQMFTLWEIGIIAKEFKWKK